jgi:hypothetical protein
MPAYFEIELADSTRPGYTHRKQRTPFLNQEIDAILEFLSEKQVGNFQRCYQLNQCMDVAKEFVKRCKKSSPIMTGVGLL